jgi:Raf kinase inhibitor-like YbhB/YbcL family protein
LEKYEAYQDTSSIFPIIVVQDFEGLSEMINWGWYYTHNLNHPMKIESPSFTQDHSIRGEYTCDGRNVNPPLTFIDVPPETRSLVLTMDDPDVPTTIKSDGIFDHWILYNIDPIITAIDVDDLVIGTSGANSAGELGYIGPCPPNGEHRYFFKLYALDTILGLSEGSTKEKVLDGMKGHVLADAELMGHYARTQ